MRPRAMRSCATWHPASATACRSPAMGTRSTSKRSKGLRRGRGVRHAGGDVRGRFRQRPGVALQPGALRGRPKADGHRHPDPSHISTSYVWRQNLTMRTRMPRFTRLTNGFSKKVENHKTAVALYTIFYNTAVQVSWDPAGGLRDILRYWTGSALDR